MTSTGVGIISNTIPLWSLCNYTRKTPETLFYYFSPLYYFSWMEEFEGVGLCFRQVLNVSPSVIRSAVGRYSIGRRQTQVTSIPNV